jgi:hypothetical protein
MAPPAALSDALFARRFRRPLDSVEPDEPCSHPRTERVSEPVGIVGPRGLRTLPRF